MENMKNIDVDNPPGVKTLIELQIKSLNANHSNIGFLMLLIFHF